MIAPVAHCAYTRATADTVVGERSMGDARLDYDEIVYGFFDKFLKGEKETRLDKLPKVTYFTMGTNEWQQLGHLAAAGCSRADLLPRERRPGQLALRRRSARRPRARTSTGPTRSRYDPANPVLSYGGNVCCTGNAIQAGAFDQRRLEARADVLVYTLGAVRARRPS